MAGRSRTRRYLLTQQGYYPGVVAANYDVWDWSTLNAGTLFQDSAKTTPVTANSDPVGAWVDRVKLTDATQATTAVKPTYDAASLNGLPTLSFDGGDLLSTANISISTFAVWCVVASSSAVAVVYEHSPIITSNDGMTLFTTSAAAYRVKRSGTIITKNSSITMSDSVYRVIRMEHNGTYASFNGYANNVLVSSTATSGDIGTGTATQPLYLGARSSGFSNPLTGNIAHLCIVSPYPTAEIIANMESYINGIWSVY